MTRRVNGAVAQALAAAAAQGPANDVPDPEPMPKMTREEARHLLNVGYAEHFGGYERRVDGDSGRFQWKHAEPDAGWTFTVPDVAASGVNLVAHLDQFVQIGIDNGDTVGWNLVRNTDGTYACAIGRRFEDGRVRPFAVGRSPVIGVAVASAMLNATDWDWAAEHARHFPGSHITDASGERLA